MKKLITVGLLLAAIPSLAQTFQNVGAGYFGHIITHPGFVLEYEIEHRPHEKLAIPLRFDMGFYRHQRNHKGLFLDANIGFRRYFGSGVIVEQSVGLGILKTYLDGDAYYTVDEQGNVSTTSPGNPLNFAPSFTLGLGYNFSKGRDQLNYLWVRPKLFWQVPVKTTAAIHPALQIGFTHTLRSGKE